MLIIISLLILSFLIFFHELGHFTVARIFNVKVETFSIGFGKELIGKTIGNTRYIISAIPLGGYVKMKGQDDLKFINNNKDNDSYSSKAPWKKICILFAGSAFNILLAFIIYIFIGINGFNDFGGEIDKVLPSTPAYNSGLKQGDLILKIDNKNMKTWRDISQYIRENINPINIEFKRNDILMNTTIIPEIKNDKNIFGENIKIGFIGISPKLETKKIQYSFIESLVFAYNETIYGSKMILIGLQKLIMRVLPISELGGPISIVQIISKAQESGLNALLGFSALISINLGILNLLPIPALDGGHIIFTTYEWIRKKPLNEKLVYKLIIFGWIILLCLMVLGIYNDMSRIVMGTKL